MIATETIHRHPATDSCGWQIATIPDGIGYHYTATYTGVLWASGWVRADSEQQAHVLAHTIAHHARTGAA